MISLAAGAIAFAAYSLNRDSTCSMGNFHTFAGLTFGFAFVMAVVSSLFAVELVLAPELAVTDNIVRLEKCAYMNMTGSHVT